MLPTLFLAVAYPHRRSTGAALEARDLERVDCKALGTLAWLRKHRVISSTTLQP